MRLLSLSRASAEAGVGVTTITISSSKEVVRRDNVEHRTVPCNRHPLVQATLGALKIFREILFLEKTSGHFSGILISNVQLILLALLLRATGRCFGYEAHVVHHDFWDSREDQPKYWRSLGLIHKTAESWFFSNASRIIVLTESDVKSILSVSKQHDVRVAVIPHCVSSQWLERKRTSEREDFAAIFVGAYIHPANRDAIDFIIDELGPRLRHHDPSATLLVVGSGLPRNLPGGSNVVIIPDAEDVVNLVDRSAICIAPVWLGSGVRTKILEYMARGKPVVATSTAMHGIEAIPRIHYRRAETAEEFAQAIIDLLGNKHERHALGQAARDLIVSKYNWKRHIPHLAPLLVN
jgi:glycosyltransferase involved in cell wall biosynthesis